MFWEPRRAQRHSDQDRAYLRERYAAIAEECERRAHWEEFVLDAPGMGVLRRLYRRLRLHVYRRAERVARADVERLRG